MNKISMFLLLVIIVLVLVGANNTDIPDAGKIGDIKMSLLSPTKFREVNGDGWVMLKGQSIDSHYFRSISGLKKLPDARGVFFRVMHLNRNDGKGDPKGRWRYVGTFQDQSSYLLHTHSFDDSRVITTFGPARGHLLAPMTEKVYDPEYRGPKWGASRKHKVVTKKTYRGGHGEENRPQNVAVYAYVKIR